MKLLQVINTIVGVLSAEWPEVVLGASLPVVVLLLFRQMMHDMYDAPKHFDNVEQLRYSAATSLLFSALQAVVFAAFFLAVTRPSPWVLGFLLAVGMLTTVVVCTYSVRVQPQMLVISGLFPRVCSIHWEDVRSCEWSASGGLIVRSTNGRRTVLPVGLKGFHSLVTRFCAILPEDKGVQGADAQGGLEFGRMLFPTQSVTQRLFGRMAGQVIEWSIFGAAWGVFIAQKHLIALGVGRPGELTPLLVHMIIHAIVWSACGSIFQASVESGQRLVSRDRVKAAHANLRRGRGIESGNQE